MNFVRIMQTITLNERKRIGYLNSSSLELSPICPQKWGTNWEYWIINFKCQSFRRRRPTVGVRAMAGQTNIKWQNAKNQTNNHETTKFRKHEIGIFLDADYQDPPDISNSK